VGDTGGWYRPNAYFDVPWRGSWEAEGGGPTMGHGIHQMDTLLSILGPWREVVAVAARAARVTETEDVSHAILTLENGATVSVVNSFLSPRETSYLRFDFERATVELEHLYGYTEDSWRFTVAPDASEEERVSLEDEWARGQGGHGSGHVAQFARVVDAIRSSSPLPVTSADARQTLELIAAIYDSAFTHRRVRRGEIDSSSSFYRSMNGGITPWLA
jgi:predicted dehydrogenase